MKPKASSSPTPGTAAWLLARKPKDRRAEKSTFPLKGNHYFLGCDGSLQDDGSFTVRILLSGVKNGADARKAAQWLHRIISGQMPKTFKIEKAKREGAKGGN